MFDIFFDSLGKDLVGSRDCVGGLKDLVPWSLEDTGEREESIWGLGEGATKEWKSTNPSSDAVFGTLKTRSFRSPATYSSSTFLRS